MQRIITALFLLVGVVACNSVKTVFKELPPYEAYIHSLERASLLEAPMAQAWIRADEEAMKDSVVVSLPFTEAGFFSAAQPKAHSYQFEVKDGQVLTIENLLKADSNSRLFVDLFVWAEENWKPLAYADSTLTLVKEFDSDQKCLLRVQPELLVNAYYSLTISATPVLINPVSGAVNKSIRSFYGDIRDGGRRSHEGLDIFAPRGTPVVAPTDGTIRKVGTNRLGGKVVWMRDSKRGHSYYFAHLDSQLVQPGRKVVQGDTLGLVGNTGNARTTAPHLHFGIYQRGSKDPLNFIRQMEALVERAPLDTTFNSQVFRVAADKLNMRVGPGPTDRILMVLERDDYVKVVGQSGDWYRITLPDNADGFVAKRLLSPTQEGEPSLLVNAAVLLSEMNRKAVPICFLPDSAAVEVLASYENFKYVRTKEGKVGWIEEES